VHALSRLQVTEEGALFRNYRNGHPILLTPESSVQAQKKYGLRNWHSS
jgi:queuine/archaeosine tRNA-ribosyltransferase